jgi:hypothetical protein
LITYDANATRLWSMKKMIKSIRTEKNSEHKFLDLVCMDQIEKILLFFTMKQSSGDKGGVINVLTQNLLPYQNVWIPLSIVRLNCAVLLSFFPFSSF